MIEKIVTAYRKMEMGLINGLSGASADVADENHFYDVGYMQTQISRIQREMKRISDEVKVGSDIKDDSDYGKQHRAELMEQREQLLYRMVFLASNSFSNLDDCLKMSEGHSFAFVDCVKALVEYHVGNHDKAFQSLEEYYREHGSVEEHFLVNKVFGLLLSEKEKYQKAIPFLTYALQFMPDDLECLNELQRCYKESGESGKENTVSDILSLLA